MFQAAIGFFLFAIAAYIFGAYGLMGISMEMGKIILLVFFILSVFSYLAHSFRGRKLK